jgi:hypothetical protein
LTCRTPGNYVLRQDKPLQNHNWNGPSLGGATGAVVSGVCRGGSARSQNTDHCRLFPRPPHPRSFLVHMQFVPWSVLSRVTSLAIGEVGTKRISKNLLTRNRSCHHAPMIRSWDAAMPEPVDQRRQTPTRKCDLCAEQMKYLGNVPRPAKGAEIRMFRCCECCLVTTETFGPAPAHGPGTSFPATRGPHPLRRPGGYARGEGSLASVPQLAPL